MGASEDGWNGVALRMPMSLDGGVVGDPGEKEGGDGDGGMAVSVVELSETAAAVLGLDYRPLGGGGSDFWLIGRWRSRGLSQVTESEWGGTHFVWWIQESRAMVGVRSFPESQNRDLGHPCLYWCSR